MTSDGHTATRPTAVVEGVEGGGARALVSAVNMTAPTQAVPSMCILYLFY